MPAEVSPVRAAGQPRLYWLDWLRFAAAFVVVLDHTRNFYLWGYVGDDSGEHPLAWAIFTSLFSLGKQAVVVFFVLSGWLVGGHTIRKVRAGTFDAAGYAADRLSRVYVPLVPALLLTLAIARVLEDPFDPWQFAACLFGWQGVGSVGTPQLNAPLWTLAYEIWFYVLAGSAAVAVRRAGAPWQRFAGIVGAGIAVGVCGMLGWVYLFCWLLGAVGFWLRDRIAPVVRPWAALAGGIIMAAGTGIFQIDQAILPPVPPAVGRLLPSPEGAQFLVAVGALLLIACLVSAAPKSRSGRWLERVGTPLAAFSYTLYLTHYPVLIALRVDLGAALPDRKVYLAAHALCWIAVCGAVALVMYALFERQTPRVRRWLRARLGGRPARAATAPDPLPLAVGA